MTSMNPKIVMVLAVGLSAHVLAQNQPAPADDSSHWIKTLTTQLKWNDPAEPMKVVGPIYFVGTRGLGAFLITTSEGHILLNTGMPGSGPMIEASIRKLGFKPEDVKILLA